MIAAELVLGALLLAVLAWELWICEGAHFGRRFVVWLYDLAAPRYDRIKHFSPSWEQRFLGEPVAAALAGLPQARVLDVGAGTGRLARALLPLPGFSGTVIAAEPSRRMLALGRKIAPVERNHWVRAWAVPLPLACDSIDLVVSLEILEFTPRPLASLREFARVLRPGGWLLVTNRVGRQARWILGRTFARDRFPAVLRRLGFDSVETYRWQIDYDLVWGQKPPQP